MKLDFIKSVFSEADGSGSASRIMIAVLVGFIVGSGATIAYRLHGSFVVADLDSFLNAAGMFIATTCSPLYLINKGAAVLKNGGQGNGQNGQNGQLDQNHDNQSH